MAFNETVLGIMQYIPYVNYNKYFQSLFILVAFFVASELIVWVSQKIILALTSKTKTDIDDRIVQKTSKPLSLILLFVGIRLAIEVLHLSTVIEDFVGKILYSIITIIATYIVVVVFDIIIDSWGYNFAKKTHSRIDDQILVLFHRFSRILFSIFGLLVVLKIFGVAIGPFLASLGIAGIAVAFAMQSTLSNIFNGISIILDKSVKVGDQIKLDAETEGEVIDVGLRSTKIKTRNNEIVIIPNGKLGEMKILNFALPDSRLRVTVEFGVEYGTDAEKVKDLVMAEIKKDPKILKDPAPDIRFDRMGDYALQFRALFWIDNYADRFREKERMTIAVYKLLNKHNIAIPFPTRTLYMKNSDNSKKDKTVEDK